MPSRSTPVATNGKISSFVTAKEYMDSGVVFFCPLEGPKFSRRGSAQPTFWGLALTPHWGSCFPGSDSFRRT